MISKDFGAGDLVYKNEPKGYTFSWCVNETICIASSGMDGSVYDTFNTNIAPAI